MNDAVLGIGKTHAADGRGIQHGFTRLGISAVGVCLTQIAGDHQHGMEIGTFGKGGRAQVHIGFHGVDKGVQPCIGSVSGRQAQRQSRIEQNRPCIQMVADNADFGIGNGVRDNADGSHFTTGSRCCGDHDGRHARTGNLMHAEVFCNRAGMAGAERRRLGAVHCASAAESDQYRRIEFPYCCNALCNGFRRGVKNNITPYINRDVSLF